LNQQTVPEGRLCHITLVPHAVQQPCMLYSVNCSQMTLFSLRDNGLPRQLREGEVWDKWFEEHGEHPFRNDLLQPTATTPDRHDWSQAAAAAAAAQSSGGLLVFVEPR